MRVSGPTSPARPPSSARGGPRTALTGAAAFAVVLVLLLGGCSGAAGSVSGKGVTLTFAWWGNADRAQRTQEAVRLFERQHPGVTVLTSFADYDSYVQKLATQAAGGNLPDVVQLDYRQISRYAGSGRLLDLGPAVEKGALRTGAMDRQLVATGTYDHTQYALPMGYGSTGFAYDASVFAKAGVPAPRPGWTWQDWSDAGRRVSALHLKGPAGQNYTGLTDIGINEDAFEDWLRGHGKRLYASQHRLGFTARDLTAFWTFTNGLRQEGVASQAKDTAQIDGAIQDGPMGRGLAATDFNWDAPYLGYPPLLGNHIHLAPVPTTDGRAGQYMKPTMLVGVGANSAHPQLSAELVDFLLNDARAGRILGVTRSTPPNRTIARDIAGGLKGPEKEVYDYGKKVTAYGVGTPPMAPPPGDVLLQVSFTRVYQRVIYGMTSPAGGAKEYVAEAKRELR